MKTLWLGAVLIGVLTWAAQAGTIEGSVEIRSPLGRKPKGSLQRHPGVVGGPLYQGPSRNPTRIDENANVVIFLLDTPGGQNKPARVRLDQKNRQFAPYVLPIYQGSTVEFVNGDSIFHSVYSQSECRPFHLPEYPQGESREITFPQAGIVELFCAIHPEMNAYLLVLDSGFFASPDAGHQFRLDNVPAGKHVIKAWHPRLPAVTKVIDVPAKGSVHVDLTL
ncbi:hypothetical protein IV102_08490 [bacterium]|nr:hypothetical protein [bacterium]